MCCDTVKLATYYADAPNGIKHTSEKSARLYPTLGLAAAGSCLRVSAVDSELTSRPATATIRASETPSTGTQPLLREPEMELRALCFTICIVCIVGGVAFALAMIWGGVWDDAFVMKMWLTLATFFCASALTLAVSKAVSDRKKP